MTTGIQHRGPPPDREPCCAPIQDAGNLHPHVHVLVTDGGFTPNGTFRPLAWSHPQDIERLFRAALDPVLLIQVDSRFLDRVSVRLGLWCGQRGNGSDAEEQVH